MGLRGPVLVATDLSGRAESALRQGHAVAEDLKAELIVCHVLAEAFQLRARLSGKSAMDDRVQSEVAQKAADAVHTHVLETTGRQRGDVRPVFAAGSKHAGILRAAAESDAGVIVLGPGTTALRVARAAHVPVLVARPSPRGTVVGATDFSDPALPAVRMAASEAARRGTGLLLVHCLDVDGAMVGAPGMPSLAILPVLSASVIDELTAAAEGHLADALASTGASGECLVARRPPADGILETASEQSASLVVVGTRGRTGLARLTLGSVAEAVMSHAPCSVLVVPLHE